jgi:hypothetical protein
MFVTRMVMLGARGGYRKCKQIRPVSVLMEINNNSNNTHKLNTNNLITSALLWLMNTIIFRLNSKRKLFQIIM